MTIKQLLGTDVNELEKMSDEELLNYLRPYIIVVQPVKKVRASNVIDVSGAVERAEKKKESMDEFVKRMTAMMTAKMQS
jgi:hypothetical protein